MESVQDRVLRIDRMLQFKELLVQDRIGPLIELMATLMEQAYIAGTLNYTSDGKEIPSVTGEPLVNARAFVKFKGLR